MKLLVVALAFAAVAACVPPFVTLPPSGRALPDHTLVIGFDGVGYDVMLEAKKRGLFPDFPYPPTRVLSPFPTLSIICFTALLEDITGYRNPGYDVFYYDHDRQQIMGGTRGEGFNSSHQYLWLFDIARRASWTHDLAYFFPRGTLKRDLVALETEMAKSSGRPQMVYVMSTDPVAHLMGREELLRQLKRVSAVITRVQRSYREQTGHPLKVVIFSDHGQSWGPQWRLDDEAVRQVLEQAGYHNADALRKPKDVIVSSFGNVRTGVVYAQEADRPGVAEIIRKQPGVELTFYRKNSGVMVLDRGGSQAFIGCEADGYRYTPEVGDPLQYASVITSLKQRHAIDATGLASARDWLEATETHPYPDALHRLCGAFYRIAQYPADILFHMEGAAMFGPWRLDRGSELAFGGIKGNHGGLGLAESSAFIISTDRTEGQATAFHYDEALRRAIHGLQAMDRPGAPVLIDRQADRRFLRFREH
jgi:hypothetical protein